MSEFQNMGAGAIISDEEIEFRRRVKEETRGKLKVAPMNTFASSVDHRSKLPAPFSQGKYGTCVACTCAVMRDYYTIKYANITPGQVARTSPMYIYNANGANSNDSGMSLRSGIDILARKGVCEANHWTYPATYDKANLVAPDTKQNTEASEYKTTIDIVYKGDDVLEETLVARSGLNAFKTALSAGHLIAVDFAITEPFYRAGASGIIGTITQATAQPYQENHAVLVVGYDDNVNGGSFLLRNSWGNTWGNNGYAYINYEDMARMLGVVKLATGGYNTNWNATTDDLFGYTLRDSQFNKAVPPQNVSLSVSVNSSNQAVLNFTAKNATSIDIYRNNVKIASSLSGSSTNYIDTTVVAGNTYKYYIEARNSTGNTTSKKLTSQLAFVNGDGTEAISIGTGSVPTNPALSVASTTTNSVTLNFSATGATSFNVFRSNTPTGTYTQVGTNVPTHFTDQGLGPNTTYYYKVAGVNSFGVGLQSSYVAATTLAAGSPPGTPTLSIGSATQNSLTLTMSASGATTFEVYRSTTASGTYGLVASNVTSPYKNTGLIAGTTYYYKVAGKNSYGTGVMSSYATGRTDTGGTNTQVVVDSVLTTASSRSQIITAPAAMIAGGTFSVYIGGDVTTETDAATLRFSNSDSGAILGTYTYTGPSNTDLKLVEANVPLPSSVVGLTKFTLNHSKGATSTSSYSVAPGDASAYVSTTTNARNRLVIVFNLKTS